jgi:Kef-type K+ transport system membrane component KefB
MIMAAPVTPLAADHLLVLLVQLALLLLGALLLGRLATRLRLPAVVGELCVGIVLGPTLLGHLSPAVSDWLVPRATEQFHLLDAIAQLGVLLLVGIAGIELDLGMVRRRRAAALTVGATGVLVPLGLGVAAGFLVPVALLSDHGGRLELALFLGVAMCVSAIPVIAKTLTDMRLLHRNVGQLTLAAATIDDVIGWLLLSVVSTMAVSGMGAADIGVSLLGLVVVLVMAVVIGRPVVRAVMRSAARRSEPGPTVAAAVVIVLLCAAGTQALGFEAVFGAFIGGALVGTSGTVDLGRLAPLRTAVLAVFAPLYFATVGLRIDLTSLADPVVLGTAGAMIAVAVVGKFTGAYLGAMAVRMTRWEAMALGAGMNARGVIQIVVAGVGLNLGVLTTETYSIVILVAVTTSMMAPPILRFAMRRVEYTAEEELRRRDRAAFVGEG